MPTVCTDSGLTQQVLPWAASSKSTQPPLGTNKTSVSNRLADGGFIVIWESGGDQDGDQTGVYAQQFDAAGNKVNGEFQINTTTAANQANPDVTIMNDGRMVAVWDADGQDGDRTMQSLAAFSLRH